MIRFCIAVLILLSTQTAEAQDRFHFRLKSPVVRIQLASGANIDTELASAIATYTTRPVELILADGGSFDDFTLPRRTTSNMITIRGASCPAEGTRVTTAYEATFPKIVAGSSSAAVVTQSSSSGTVAQYYTLKCVFVDGLTTASQEAFVVDGTGLLDSMTSLADRPNHIYFDQVIVKGDATNGLRRGFRLNGTNLAVTNSYCYQVFQPSSDSQCIAFWNGTDTLLIDNNYLSAAAENIMSGGTRCWTETIPANITVTNNTLTKDLAWRDNLSGFQVKNVFEVKFGRSFYVADNIIENSWDDNQDGWLILLTAVRNTAADQPFIEIDDVTFERNIIRNGCGGIQFGTLSGPVTDITFYDNWFDNIEQDAFLCVAKTKLMQLRNGVANFDFSYNTITDMADEHSMMYLEPENNNNDWSHPEARSATIDVLTFENNIAFEGDFGIFHSSGQGTTALNALATMYSVTANVIWDDATRSITYPMGNNVLAIGSDISAIDAGSPTFGQEP